MTANPLRELRKLGQSFWYDGLSRGLIASGEVKRLMDEDDLRGMTSNPTIFERAISGSADYDEQIRALAERGASTEDIYEALVLQDIGAVADVLRAAYDRTQGADGFISVEVLPSLAHDTAGTVEQARHYFGRLNRPNVMVKVPSTAEGMPAIRALTAAGVNVNITLIFSLDAYRQVVDAYFSGLEDRLKAGQPIQGIASASFFVSRVDTAVDRLLQAKIQGEADARKQAELKGLLGQAAIANAKAAYRIFKEMHGGERFAALRAKGGRPQRVLWASTSTKNPAYPDLKYVEALIGPDTVDTMPPETVDAFRDHGRVAPTLEQGPDAARAALDGLRANGIDLDGVTRDLLAAGVQSFEDSFRKLMASIAERRGAFTRESDRVAAG